MSTQSQAAVSFEAPQTGATKAIQETPLERLPQRSPIARLTSDYLRPHWLRIGAAIVCMLIVAGTTALTIWLLDPAIRFIFERQDPQMLILIPLAVVGANALKAAAAYGQGVLVADVSRRLASELQTQLFAKLIGADIAHLKEGHSGTYQTHFLQNANLVANALSNSLVGIFRDIPTAIGLIIVMFLMDWQLALAAIIVAPLVAVLTGHLSRRAKKSISGTIEASNQLSKNVAEILQGVRIVRAYGQEDAEINRAGGLISERMRLLFRAQRASLAAAPLTEAFAGVGIAIAIYYGGMRVLSGSLDQSAFFTFIASMLMAFQPMRTLSNLVTVWAQGVAAAEQIFVELDTEPGIRDKAGAQELRLAGLGGANVELQSVTFDYGGEGPALRNVTLAAGPGQTIALVGASGAGKSTVLSLLLRFYDPQDGSIRIDGQDIRDVTLHSLRDKIALVTQEAILFDDTIEANIAYGKPGASRAEIENAARNAAAHDFISQLPGGYGARVGEDGGLLSGGQRQRIAIARALLNDAPILLLDEATSALDSTSEAHVQAALATLMRGRTTIVIAHRLSTIQSADRIYVLDQGRIVESGTHCELLEKTGAYNSLYKTQFSDTAAAEVANGSEA